MPRRKAKSLIHRATIECLETRRLLSTITENGTTANDLFIVQMKPSDRTKVQVYVNGVLKDEVTAASVSLISLYGEQYDDTLQLGAYNSGSGDSLDNMPPIAFDDGDSLTPLILEPSPESEDAIVINDQTTAGPLIWDVENDSHMIRIRAGSTTIPDLDLTITSSRIDRLQMNTTDYDDYLGFGYDNYFGAPDATVNSGGGNDTLAIDGPTGSTDDFHGIANLGDDDDVLNVYGLDELDSNVGILGQSTINGGNGDDHFNFGVGDINHNHLVAANVNPITISGGAGSDLINVDDRDFDKDDLTLNGTPINYSIDDDSIDFGATDKGPITYDTAEGITLHMQSGNDTHDPNDYPNPYVLHPELTVNNTNASTPVIVYPGSMSRTISSSTYYDYDVLTVNRTNAAAPVTLHPSDGRGQDHVTVGDGTHAAKVIFAYAPSDFFYPDAYLPEIGSLTIGSSSVAKLNVGTLQALKMSSLSIATSGQLDVNDASALIDYSGSSPAATIRSYLTAGYNGNTWTGNGISSSAAAADTDNLTVGYAEATDLFTSFPGTIAGRTDIDNTTVVIRFTVAGDATLNRTVNLSDLILVRNNYGISNPSYYQGDFNYSNSVNLSDLIIVRNKYGNSIP